MEKINKNILKRIRERIKKYKQWNIKRYENRKDKENIFPIGLTDQEFVKQVTNIFLGEGYYCVDPLSHNQINEVILRNIIYILNEAENPDGKN